MASKRPVADFDDAFSRMTKSIDKLIAVIKQSLGLALFLFALSTDADAQVQIGTCRFFGGSGSPEGVVVGRVCDLWLDTADGVLWAKWSGVQTNTGWQVGHNANARVNGNLNIIGYVGEPSFVSQLTTWRIDALGAADFRYVFADGMHVEKFVTDLEIVLAGSQLICKSVSTLGANFTNPAAAGTATLTVKDLPSMENTAVFESGDYVGIRVMSRFSGALIIGDTYGVVTAYADQVGGLQAWTFTRGSGANAGTLATSTVVQINETVIDFGVSGSGCAETSAIDGLYGINSPYFQTWTWTTSPITANRTIRTRLGNLRGVTGNTNEYGLLGGVLGGAATAQYFIASNLGLRLFGVDIEMFDGAGTRTIHLNRSGPYLSLGAAAPTAYSAGTGIFMGNDVGTYKFRVGVPGGVGVFWDGTTLSVVGQITATSGLIGGWTIDSTNLRDTSGVVGMSSAVTGGDDIRFWAGNATPGSAPYRVLESGALFASNATITGAISASSISGGTIDGTTITGVSVEVGTSDKLWLNVSCSGIIFSIGGTTCASAPFNVYANGDFISNSAQFTGGVAFTGGVPSAITFGSSLAVTFSGFTGGGDRVVCVGNTGILFMGASSTAC